MGGLRSDGDRVMGEEREVGEKGCQKMHKKKMKMHYSMS